MKLIPSHSLSYNPIETSGLQKKLEEYEGRHHDDFIVDFETALCSLTQAKHVVALNSGTAAIHLSLKALGVGEGDVVMATSFTYVASINPIRYLGAVPYFIDSNADDWNMCPELLEEGITRCIRAGRKPKAILLVHTYGMPASVKEIKTISEHYEIPVLEDAAEALGSKYEGEHVGTLGEIGIISFNNNKLITTYGGGALLTNDSLIASKVGVWASQSRDNLPFYEHSEIGYNYKMGPLNAAMGLSQLELLPDKVRHRRQVFAWYQDHIADRVTWQHESSSIFTNRWITAGVMEGIDVQKLQNELLQRKIETRRLWKPMHLQPVFKEFKASTNGNAERLFKSGLCLPSGNDVVESFVEEICAFIGAA